ncbi:MAG: ABC transporter permease subunit [Rhodocyclaceae bacterium]|nr:ABC transporter permease subunit [Rhodocyclaceae bacterium]
MIFAIGLLLIGGAYLASLFSPRQPQTVALDVGLSGLRFALVLQALFWVQELVGREIERKTVVLSLAYPVPRSHYVLGRFFGIALLLAVATLILALLLWLMVLSSGRGYDSARQVALGLPYWLTIGGLYLDVLVVLGFALCLATLSTVLVLPLALGAVFAVIGRSLGSVMDFLLTRQADGDAEMVAQFGPVIRVIYRLLPDLSRLDWRDWTLYNLAPDGAGLTWSLLMAGGYILLLLAIAVLAFQRREFA